MKLIRAVQALPGVGGAEDVVDSSGDKPMLNVAAYGKLARAKLQSHAQLMPYAGATAPAASIYDGLGGASVSQWLDELCVPEVAITPSTVDMDQGVLCCLALSMECGSGVWTVSAAEVGLVAAWNAEHPDARIKKGDRLTEVNGRAVRCEKSLAEACTAASPPAFSFARSCPNEQQLAVLRHVAARVKQECLEERAGTAAMSNDDPLFELVHGLPGTGKSRVIAWIRELFVEILGWTHGSQFVCLAFQNTMAANINGSTIHSWSGIPVFNNTRGHWQGARDIGAL